ncbi:DUF5074 domain-containing protein [Flavobacterium rivuli]|uniref:DUF5074 domain-containing protein n=1 Tax=Flavobacterium rivuli TaxID=498301 RepID=UPI00037975E5|nr:DUF5074 domain-containing protein [Flavobacterium rivuli]
MKKLYTVLFLFLSGLVAFAQNYTDGIFVLNEGNAGTNGASVSFIKNNTVTNDIYSTANNNAALGNTGQSFTIYGDYAYIVLNMSNKVEIVNKYTLAHVASIETGLNNPRYMAFSNGKGFVTNWGNGGVTDGYIAVLNLEDNTVEDTIAVAQGPERILETNGTLYVAHQGGFGYGNTVSVIDPVAVTVSESVTVGDVPNSMLVKDDFLYVLCGGSPSWSGAETFGALYKIDIAANTVLTTVNFPEEHPANLRAGNGDNVYYTIDADIFKTDITATTLPETPIASLAPQGAYGVYGMDFIDDILYVADAVDYSSPGHVYLYDANGVALTDYTVGVIPNGFYKSAAEILSVPNPVAALKITVAPNPTADVFYINTNTAAGIKMYNVQGRLVKDEPYTANGVAVRDLSAGLYFVEITTGQSKNVQRLIVK